MSEPAAAASPGRLLVIVPAGWSIHMTLALLFQEKGLGLVKPSRVMVQGPFSVKSASSDEQPGPPVSHTISGSLDGSLLLSKK